MDISVSSMEYDIEKIVDSIDFNKNSYQCINNIMLTNFEIKPAAIPLTLDDGLRLSLIYKKR